MLLAAGFSGGIIGFLFSQRPVGEVISQNPPEGSLVKHGSAVSIDVSMGLAVIVPDVLGRMKGEATATLANAGLKSSYGAEGSVQPKDQVIRQTPPGASRVAVNSTVNLTLSDGPVIIVVPGGERQPEGQYCSAGNAPWRAEALVQAPTRSDCIEEP